MTNSRLSSGSPRVGLEANFYACLAIIDAAAQEVVAWDNDSGRGIQALLGFLPLEDAPPV